MYSVKAKPVIKSKMVCSECGSDNIVAYAAVYWDYDKQEWVFDDFTGQDDWCNICEGETSVEEVRVRIDPPEWP